MVSEIQENRNPRLTTYQKIGNTEIQNFRIPEINEFIYVGIQKSINPKI